MDRKFYISLEAARLLKEKGYDRECIAYYQNDEFHPYAFSRYDLSINDKNAVPPYMNQYSAPTKAEAIDWLERKGIIVELSVTHDLCHWVFSIYMKGGEGILTNVDFDFDSFSTRLEAEDAAIIKALELL